MTDAATVAARHDPASGADARIVRRGDRLTLELRPAGRDAYRAVAAPDGYAISHFADAPGIAVICGGAAPHDGWWDWQFALDVARATLSRTGPAY